MEKTRITASGADVPLVSLRAAVAGSGAAALNAAVHLKRLGVDDVAIFTERMGAGVSANAGSDKQTYYRLDPSGDSVRGMASRLFAGGCVHGDIALVEAALSLLEFYHLAILGVGFPFDRYGSFASYRTDHDELARGSSAGPDTSIMMYQRLRDEAALLGVPVFEGLGIVDIVATGEPAARRAVGLVAMGGPKDLGGPYGLTAVRADFIVLGTGGPGELYADSVCPPGQTGTLGAALTAGAAARNLSESQFGIASRRPRWNLSGSYQQALPRYYSTSLDGSDEREFLADFFPSREVMLLAQFRKGYEWPFDALKVSDYGSSCVDLLVYYESAVRSRRVFVDYRANPSFSGAPLSIPDELPAEAKEYLGRSGALEKTPAERLIAMNAPAYGLFLKNGVDLAREPLEIAVCHQHVNGGLCGDIWWESNVRNLFPVGEANGSHGVYRPGGAALNAGQVGGLRAAQMIAHRHAAGEAPSDSEAEACIRAALEARLLECRRALSSEPMDWRDERQRLKRRMSRALGILREPSLIERALSENAEALQRHRASGVAGPEELRDYFVNAELLAMERCFLETSSLVLGRIAGGRGSYLAGAIGDFLEIDAKGRASALRGPKIEAMALDETVEVELSPDGRPVARVVGVRPVPEEDAWFERVWREHRDGSVYGTA